MSYLTLHHGTFWFQLRVPVPHADRFGKIVRLNLQTSDPAAAKALALRLASEWLTRFQTESLLTQSGGLIPQPELDGGSGDFPESKPQTSDVPRTASVIVPSIEKKAAPTVTDKVLFDAWDRLDRERVGTTTRDMREAITAFRKVCRKPWAELERRDVANFRDHLLAKRLARATVAKKVGFISTLLQVGVDAGLLQHNIARGMKIPRAEIPTLERRSFTQEELRRVFSSPVYRASFRPVAGCGAACVWMPMIGLVTGARLEEIAQLLVDDIVVDDEHGPLMRITDEDESQRLKNTGSRRIVPLHPEILRVGFLEYVEHVHEAGHKWVFPDLLPDHDGRRGGNFGKWWQRYLRSPRGIGITDPRIVFHSFRHTFKTLCRAAGISEEVHDALTGHVSATVSRKYGEMPIEPLVKAIHSIKLPVALPRIEK